MIAHVISILNGETHRGLSRERRDHDRMLLAYIKSSPVRHAHFYMRARDHFEQEQRKVNHEIAA